MAKSKPTAPKSSLNPTKNDLKPDTRKKVIDILNARVADAIDLQYQVRTAHFNVKGPGFGSLHLLFEAVYKGVDEFVDEIAERAVQLGGTAQSTIRIAAAASTLPEYPTDVKAGLDHTALVSDRLALFGKLIRQNIDDCDDAGDADTADLLTDVSRAIDKFTWMVEAHNQGDR
jgi:starvation-inducible DNA-binding protein